MNGLSEDAQQLIASLSESVLYQIRKDNPFRVERDGAIQQLCERGAKQKAVAELSGLSRSSISRIALRGYNRNETKRL